MKAICACVVGLLAWLPWGARAAGEADAYPERIRVLDPAGAPHPEAVLVRAARRLQGVPLLALEPEVLARADADGTLGLPDAARDPAADPPFLVLAPGSTPRRLGGLDAEGRLVLAPGRRHEGRVRWSGGLSAGGAALVLLPVTTAQAVGLELKTDAQGRFASDRLTDGAWKLVLERRDGRRIVLRGFHSGEAPAEAVAPAGGGLAGRLVDAALPRSQGAPDVGVRVVLLPRIPEAPAVVVDGRSDVDGRFLLPDLPAGIYEVELTSPDWRFDQPVARTDVPEGVMREASWFVARRPFASGRALRSDGAPIEGARVTLLYPAGRIAAPAQPRVQPPTVGTDAEGRFTIPRLEPAEGLRLVVEAAGWATLLSDPVDVGPRGATELGAYRLERGWTLDLEVRDADQKPRAGVAVLVTPASRPAAAEVPGLAALARRTQTDAGGLASFATLPLDDAIVTLTLPGHVPYEQRVTRPLSGGTRREQVVLARAPSLRGRVAGQDGLPAVGRTLRIRLRGLDHAVARDGRTGDGGQFELTDLLPQAYDLEVLGTQGQTLLRREGVMPGEETLDLVLPPLLGVTGSVEGLREQGPQALALLEAPVEDARGERRWRVIARSVLPSGSPKAWFGFQGLAPGDYSVRVSQGALDTDAAPVRLEERDVDVPTLRLAEPGSVAGSVVDGEGRPLLGVRVSLVRLRGDGDAPPLPGGPLLAASDDRGGYVFSSVATGLWRVEATDPGRGGDVEVLRVAEAETLIARDLVLDGGAALEGLVRDARGGRVDGALVRAQRLEADVASEQTRTAHDGAYQLEGLVPGTWRVEVSDSALGVPRRQALVNLRAGERARLDFEPAQRGAIIGTVTRRGERAAGVTLRAEWLPEDGSALERVQRAHTDAFGAYAFEGLEAGRYQLVIEDGTVRTGGEIVLEDGDTLTADMELWEGRMTGEVVDAGGRRVPYAEVEAVPTQAVVGELRARVRTGPDGQFALTGLPVGRYDLRVRAAGRTEGLLADVRAELPGSDRPVTVVLERGAEVDVEVRGPDGRPVSGVRLTVTVNDEDRPAAVEAITGPSGRLRLQGVPPGEVRVSAHARDLGRASGRINVVDGESRRLDLRIEPAGVLYLKVTSDGPDPTSRTRIDVVAVATGEVVARRRPLRPSRWSILFGLEPRTGQLTLRDLAAGDYEVRLNAGPRYEPVKTLVRVRAGEATRALVELPLAK